MEELNCVRAGSRQLKKLPSQSVSSSGVRSSTQCRFAVLKQTSTTSLEGASVSKILSSTADEFNWLSVEAGRSISPVDAQQHFVSDIDAIQHENPFQETNESQTGDQSGGFFDSMFNNPMWAAVARSDGEQHETGQSYSFPCPSPFSTNYNQDGAFFSMDHVLQDEPRPPAFSGNNEPETDPDLLVARSIRNHEDLGSVFKTPMLVSEDDSSSRREKDYDSILDTPLMVKELPRLSTPLFSAKLESESPQSYSKTNTETHRKSKSGKATTEPSSTADSAVVVALTEGRGYAVGEVGLAFINMNEPTLILSQISDSQTYSKTLTKINFYNPMELVVPDTFVSDRNTSDLYKRVAEYFSTIKVVSVKRLCFNAEHGLDSVRSLCLPECSSVDIIAHRKYYALAAAAALLKYIEHEHKTVFAKQSIKIRYEAAKGVVALDLSTSRRLELVKTNGEMVDPEKYSLMGTMCATVTLGGKRRLRSEILQPLASRDIIENRLDVVSYLVSNTAFLVSLQGTLVKFSNAEKLMWLCKKIPDFKREKKSNETMTNYVLLLKSSLENLPLLRDTLSESENDFLLNVREILSDQRFQQMLDLVSQKIHSDAKPSRGYQGAEINRCFSIKDGVNGLLDVARSTYSKLVQEIQDLITKLADEHDMPLKMGQSAELGFHGLYVLPKNSEIISSHIPSVFTDVKIKGNNCHVSTDDMFSLNVRIRRAVQEIQLISNVILFELIKDLRPLVGCLYNLCEYVALLDLISSIAKYSSSPNFTRPVFGDRLNIVGGRHPILDHLDPVKPTPNDVFASKNKNVTIITGPNMSGKTVYLLQIALLQIMAQIGSYVPAESAEFRITDHIYVRKDGSERVENKVSGFAVEVKEIMYCLSTTTDTSLVILDELCTATNNEGGTAVAWAVCEQLLSRPAFTFIATHLQFLTQLENVFVNVSNYHMEAIESSQAPLTYGPLTFTYRLLKGVTQISHYGLRLMMTTMLPESLKNDAAKIVEELTRRRENCLALAKKIPADVQIMMSRVDKLEKFMKDLYTLSKSEHYSLDTVQQLQRLAVDTIIVDEMRARILNEPGTPPPSCHFYQPTPTQSPKDAPLSPIRHKVAASIEFLSTSSLEEQPVSNTLDCQKEILVENIEMDVSQSAEGQVVEENSLDSDDYSDDYDENEAHEDDIDSLGSKSTRSVSRQSLSSASSFQEIANTKLAQWSEFTSHSFSSNYGFAPSD